MHTIEPYYNWRHIYISEEDTLSPFYLNEYSEFEFSDKIYNHYIHPQWDNIGSPTLFIKIIYANYENSCAIIELIGEWNDCIHNDIMTFKRDIIDHLILNGIIKFVLIGENVLNFHYSDDCYYEEWMDEIEDGWIVALNFHQHVLQEMQQIALDQYLIWGGELNDLDWRTYKPNVLIDKIEAVVHKRLGY
jgi:hypothetical protein